MAEEQETGRVEAFSDGVFAIAVTLLVLELRAPLPADLRAGETLWDALRHEWPSYLAFATSFATILIVWVNHHYLFRLIRRTDHVLLLLNGLLLFVVTLIPFPTDVVAEYLRAPGARTAAVFYAGTFLAVAFAFNGVWQYARHDGRLLSRDADPRTIRTINQQFRMGPLTYLVAVAVAALNGLAGLALVTALAVYWALPAHLRPGPGRGA
ncbi:MAG TPA: TMEM175 family protein [Thermomicrobiales bacterium]|nr:TMEM175 family protein [Thermomicrobiales bacterium]